MEMDAMSDVIPQALPVSKQFLMVVDEASVMVFNKLMPSIVFVPVEGLSIKDDPLHMVLVSPLPPVPSMPSEDVVMPIEQTKVIDDILDQEPIEKAKKKK